MEERDAVGECAESEVVGQSQSVRADQESRAGWWWCEHEGYVEQEKWCWCFKVAVES